MTPREDEGIIRWHSGVSFAIVPEWVIRHPDLSHAAVRVYALLAYYASSNGNSTHTRASLASELRMGKSTLDEKLKELRTHGCVTIENRQRLDGSFLPSNYWVHGTPTEPALSPGEPGHPSPAQPGHPSRIPGTLISTDDSGSDVNPRDVGVVRELFDHWRTARGHKRAHLNDERRTKIKARLKRFTADQLHQAIDGVANDPWPDRVRHDDLLVIFRNDSQVEKFLDLYAQGPTTNDRELTPEEILALANR